jgi:hypothetical protein
MPNPEITVLDPEHCFYHYFLVDVSFCLHSCVVDILNGRPACYQDCSRHVRFMGTCGAAPGEYSRHFKIKRPVGYIRGLNVNGVGLD